MLEDVENHTKRRADQATKDEELVRNASPSERGESFLLTLGVEDKGNRHVANQAQDSSFRCRTGHISFIVSRAPTSKFLRS